MAPSFSASEARYKIESGELDYVCGRCMRIFTDIDDWNMDRFDQEPTTNHKKACELHHEFIQQM